MLHFAHLSVRAGQSQTIFFTQPSDQNCATNIQLIALSTSGLPLTFTLVQGNGILNNTGLLIPAKPGRFIIKASQPGNAVFDSAVSITREFSVLSNKQSEASGIALKVKSSLCMGDPADLYITSISGLNYVWELEDGVSYSGTNYHINTLVSSLNCSGVIRIKEGNCEILNINFALEANAKTDLSITVSDSIISGDTIVLKGSPTGGTFEGNGVIDSLFLPSTGSLKLTDTITYTYQNNYGCFSEISKFVTIHPKPDIAEIRPKIYEYITPNGDTKNDFFKIENIDLFPENELVIFNSWGNELYRTSNYKNEWSPGLSKGIYYYDFKLINREKHYTGQFYVSP